MPDSAAEQLISADPSNLFGGIDSVLRSLQGDVPNILFHYTSAEGMLGILQSQSLWLTDLRYMNDMSELQYARDIVKSHLDRLEAGDNINLLQKQFLKHAKSHLHPHRDEIGIFSASFCESGNILSQWRAYRGAGGGYALGVDFLRTLPLVDLRCELVKIVYNREQQLAIVYSFLSDFMEFLGRFPTLNPDDDQQVSNAVMSLVVRFETAVTGILPVLKHPDFHEEREWRLVHFVQFDERMARRQTNLRFRPFQGNVIPYLSLDFGPAFAASRDDLMLYGFPFREIMIGPTVSSELNESSLRRLLLAANPDAEPKITRSDIPLRWL